MHKAGTRSCRFSLYLFLKISKIKSFLKWNISLSLIRRMKGDLSEKDLLRRFASHYHCSVEGGHNIVALLRADAWRVFPVWLYSSQKHLSSVSWGFSFPVFQILGEAVPLLLPSECKLDTFHVIKIIKRMGQLTKFNKSKIQGRENIAKKVSHVYLSVWRYI